MDQVLVQRVFAAKNLNEGRLGAILCGFLKLTTPFVLVLPGLIARAKFPNLAKADEAYGMLLRNIMPQGSSGLDRYRHRRSADGPHQRDLQLSGNVVHP
jgi:solute:Na+ symporter, SSS family